MLITIIERFDSTVLGQKVYPTPLDENGKSKYAIYVDAERGQALIDGGVAQEYFVEELMTDITDVSEFSNDEDESNSDDSNDDGDTESSNNDDNSNSNNSSNIDTIKKQSRTISKNKKNRK